MSNIVDAYPREGVVFRTKPLFQWDWGQIVRLHISDLPAAYKVEFSNSTRTDAVSTVQTTDEVTVPAQFLESGNPVYAWVVVVDEARTTEYSLMIPVSARAKPTDTEPTPEEQSEIEQTLAALNEAVSDVQEIADAIPDTISDALEAAKESGEFDGADGKDGQDGKDGKDGADGFSPTAAVNKAGNASTITITDKNGTTTATVLDGKDGKDGADGYTPQKGIDYFDGEDGQDGQTGPAGKDGKDGSPGADGVSPSITVTDITGGHRVTITDATGQHSFDVMDGEGGQGAVQDVQVGGTSVVQGGVAEIPVASDSSLGAVKTASWAGVRLETGGQLNIRAAGPAIIKAGTNSNYPLASCNLDVAAFYGLSKAAGADMASSSNPVGTYTDAAKSAIQTMLNGPVTVSGTTPSITALPGIQYVCGECATLDITLPASGCVDVVFESGATPTVLTITPPTGATVKWANGFDPTALEANTTYEINIKDGLGVGAAWT